MCQAQVKKHLISLKQDISINHRHLQTELHIRNAFDSYGLNDKAMMSLAYAQRTTCLPLVSANGAQ